MEDRTANIITIASIINLTVLIIVSRIIFHLTEPFFLILGASLAAILATIGFYIIRRNNHSRRQQLETIIASEGKELRIEYSFLRKVAGLPTKFKFQELEEATDNWKSLIGKGGSATVYKGCLKDGTAVAVKRIQHGEDRGEKEFRSEIAAIASVQHVNLVRLIGYCIHTNNLHFLVYDFIPNGSLSNWIYAPLGSAANSRGGGCLTWSQRLKVAVDVAKALAYLHHDCRSKVLHLDVKPENILLDGSYNAIVSDFGISKLMRRDDSRIVTGMRGTRGYIAPEWLLGVGISEKSDVFSYGIVLFELISGRRSIKAIDVDAHGNKIRRRFEYFPKIITEKLKAGHIMETVDTRLMDLSQVDENEVKKLVHVALWCIQDKPRRRPSMTEVVKWLEGRVAVEEPPETKMIVVDLLSIAKGENGEDVGWQNRNKIGLVVLYLNKAEARDKICRTIQYGSKFVSKGEAGTAQNVEKSTALARKVFRLFKFVNDLHALISPTAPGTPLPIVLLGKSKNALLSTFLFLDQIVWLHRSGIYKNKEKAEIIGRISLYCWMGSSICSTLVELGELGRLSKSMKKLSKELKGADKHKNEQYRAKLATSNERTLALIKAAMDVVVAVGLLQLAPKKITPRVTGAFGFTTSLISCYQLLPSAPKSKTP